MSESVVLYDLERLKRLYRAGFQDTFLDNALRKIIDHQITRDQEDLQQVNKILSQFEQQYGFASDEFWDRFQAGEMEDKADFMEWNVFCKMKQRIESRLQILQDEGIDE
jgi:DNA-binding MltR family transcriptional regulator